MFSSRFFARKNLLQKGFPLFFALCLVMGSALFSSCDWGGGTGDYSLVGKWSSGSDGYEITDTTMIYTGYTGYSFKAKIHEIIEFDPAAISGVIIVEYTTKPTAYTPPGNFQGVYYKDLTAKSVKLGSAYTAADYTNPVEVSTLAAAREKFKKDNIALYGGELTQAVPQTRQ